MDGKIMGFTPPDKFSFDLQRFTFEQLSEGDTVPAEAIFTVVKNNGTYYGTEASDFTTTNLENGIYSASSGDASAVKYIRLLKDLTLTEDVDIGNNRIWVSQVSVTLDLAGKSLSSTNSTAVVVSPKYRYAETDTKKAQDVQATSLTINNTGGDNSGKHGAIISNAKGWAIVVVGDGNESHAPSLIVDGGYIKSGDCGISGIGNDGGASGTAQDDRYINITINNGKIISNDVGLYFPGDGTLNINGGEITGATGVEIRAGSLNVTGGTITGTSTTYFTAHSNGNGSTSSGAGIAIAQHTTKKAITVNISGDAQVSGQVALSVTNPNSIDNTAGDVKVNVTGGEFEGKQASLFYQDNRSELDVTGGDFKGAVVSTYSESKPNNKDNEVTINTAQGASDAAVTTTGVSDKVKIAGGTYSSDSNIKKYLSEESANVAVQNADGTYGVANKGAGWSLVEGNQYQYLISTGGDNTASLLTANNVNTTVGNLISDSLYRVIGVADNDSITTSDFNTTANDSLTAKFSWAKFTLNNNEMSISPQTEGVKIAGTAFVGNNTTVLTAAGATNSIYVDATSNSLASIVGGDSTDYLKAGNRATTIDGGKGNDTLIGGTKNDSLRGGDDADLFIYSGGSDTIADYNSSQNDLVKLSGVDAVTDGSKLGKVTGGFRLTFSSGNTLTFQDENVVASVKNDTSTFTYTKDAIMQGAGATLAADTTTFEATGDTYKDIASIDGSAATSAVKITGNAKDNYIIAGNNGSILDGGAGNDTLEGGSGVDNFVYSAGNDVIESYKYGTDNISVESAEKNPPTSFEDVKFDGSNFVFKFGADSLQVNDTSNVALLKTAGAGSSDIATYSYKGHSGGGMDYIAQEGKGISLGAGYTTKNYDGRNRNYQTIDASHVTLTTGIELRANDNDSTLIGASMGGALYGGDGKDYIKSGLVTGVAASIKATLDGGSDGDDTLEGTGNGIETFVYRGGNDSISGYNAARGDLISIRGFNPGEATIAKKTGTDDGNTLVLTFDAETNALSIAGGASAADNSAISVQSGNRLYTYTKDYVAYNKGITLASDYSETKFDGADTSNSEYVTINAVNVAKKDGDTAVAFEVIGNNNSNYIVGSSVASAAAGDTLAGGKGNDRIDVNERGDKSKYVFKYTEGKDEVFGFNQTNDTLDITAASIKSAKVGNNKLTLTVKKNSDVLTLRGDEITKVSLASGSGASYLTKDGYVTTADKTLKLFSSAKGRIELGDQLYSLASNDFVTTVNADSVENQSVTLVGSSLGGEFKYKSDNKKRDGFVYGGGKVSISGYEPGKDRIDLNGSTLTSFTVEDGSNVKLLLNSDGNNQYISVASAANKEVLLRDGSSRSFKKMVFVQNGILQNKAKNPTMVTVSAGATGTDNTYTVADSVKKVFVTEDLKTPIKIQAGNKNNTVIDASAAANTVTLSGGKKNDKLIGNTANADTFVYSAGKDIIQGYTSTDNISITDFDASVKKAKITAGSKSIKFKFTNKNTLTVKANKGESLSGALNINGLGQTYAKNAIAKDGAVTLTSAFSGTFKTVGTKGLDGTMTTVNGSAVSKNLTFKGTAADESLTGGKKKNTFKGGGGNDTLTGSEGAKDIFFYAKGDKGTTTIANFEFGANKDRLKIASGTIGEITTLDDGKTIQFAMNSGKKGDTSNIGWFKVEKGTKDIAIKANNTYYWFADKEETIGTGDDTLTINSGQLITSDTRVSASDVSGYDIIDLNYSTNLAKSGVAVKVTSKPPTKSNSNS